MLRTVLLIVLAAVALAGCGGSERSPGAVVEGWAEALTLGTNAEAAAFFADRPLLIQGFLPTIPRTRQGIVNWHATLECGGEITGLAIEGKRVTATFALADRAAFRCPAPGYLSTVVFFVEDGLIERWSQTLPGTIVESE